MNDAIGQSVTFHVVYGKEKDTKSIILVKVSVMDKVAYVLGVDDEKPKSPDHKHAFVFENKEDMIHTLEELLEKAKES